MDTCHEQLRAAKRRQRHRDRAAGQVLYQLKLPAALRERLKAGMRRADFVEKLHAFLRHEVIRIADYPQLALLCWNIHDEYLTRNEALAEPVVAPGPTSLAGDHMRRAANCVRHTYASRAGSSSRQRSVEKLDTVRCGKHRAWRNSVEVQRLAACGGVEKLDTVRSAELGMR